MPTAAADSGVRLADLVAAFSLATDLGLGQPMDHVLRAWRIAAALGEHVGLEPEDRGSLYFVVTLAWVGCVADTPEVAALFGDDIAFRADSYDVDLTGLPMRLFHLADTVEAHHRTGGTDAALGIARAKQGTHFDPAVVDTFCAVAADVLGDPTAEHDWDALLDREPTLQEMLTEDQFDAALEAIADFTDLRSVHRAGHSRAVADLAERAATEQGLPPVDVVSVRRAALVHELGLHAIPSTILDRPHKLRPAEWERLRMHPYYTERMLARPDALARLGAIASLVRERCDGSGYPRGLTAATIPATVRTLAAACAFRALIETRAHRLALAPEQAAAELRAEVRAGRLDPAAVDAVLAAAGQPSGKRRRGPSGLTPREIEVLVLIARGGSTRQVAQNLSITPKTVETHIERIYTKTGASTRSTATLFALQHGLLGTLEPLDL